MLGSHHWLRWCGGVASRDPVTPCHGRVTSQALWSATFLLRPADRSRPQSSFHAELLAKKSPECVELAAWRWLRYDQIGSPFTPCHPSRPVSRAEIWLPCPLGRVRMSTAAYLRLCESIIDDQQHHVRPGRPTDGGRPLSFSAALCVCRVSGTGRPLTPVQTGRPLSPAVRRRTVRGAGDRAAAGVRAAGRGWDRLSRLRPITDRLSCLADCGPDRGSELS